MSENTNEITEADELSPQDIADLAEIGMGPDGEPLKQVSLLRAWSEVLSNVESNAAQPVSIGIAHRIVQGWPQIHFQETPLYHQYYHEYLIDVRDILQEKIDANPGAIDFEDDDDLAENSGIYRELIIEWNLLFDKLEREWIAEDPHSHIEFAALVDARGFVFSREGLAGHLEARGFTMSTEEVVEAIKAARGEQ